MAVNLHLLTKFDVVLYCFIWYNITLLFQFFSVFSAQSKRFH